MTKTITRSFFTTTSAALAVVAVLFISLLGIPQAKAATQEELQAMIAQLMAQIALLQSHTETMTITTPSATPVVSPVTAASTSDIAIGTSITTTDVLRVRGAAGVHAAFIATQPVGAKGTVVAGPVKMDGYNWYKVDYETGADGWNVGGWLRKQTDLPDALGTYIGYMNGSQFAKVENINRWDALAKCKESAAGNPKAVIRCTFRGSEIFVSTEVEATPRVVSATLPVDSSVVTVYAVFGAPTTGMPAVTGPTTVGKVNWGDGTADETVNALFAASEAKAKIKHTYTAKGTYTITLTGLDGKTAVETIKVTKVSTDTATTTTGEYFGYIEGVESVHTTDSTKAAAEANCKTTAAANTGKEVYCTWNGKVVFTNVELGTYKITYSGGAHGGTENISKKLALANCLLNVNSNPGTAIVCTWNGKQIYPTAVTATSTTYTLADVKSVTKKVVDPIPTAADDEYTLYRIVLNNGKVHEVKVGFMPVSYRDEQFRKTGYTGDIEKLMAMATVVTPVVTAPGKNNFGCNRSVTTKQATGTVACYGIWDFEEDFGGDVKVCGSLGDGKTGCVIQTPVCASGVAKATTYMSHDTITTAQLATISTRLKVTPEVAKAGIAGLWEYKCTAPVTAGAVLGASTDIYSEIGATLNLISDILKNLK